MVINGVIAPELVVWEFLIDQFLASKLICMYICLYMVMCMNMF